MAIIEGGTTGSLVEVGNAAALAQHVTNKAFPHGALGHYRVGTTTGTLAAALATSAQLFYLRWTDATRFCVITRFQAKWKTLTLFTPATIADFGFELHRATAVSAGGGGTDLGALTKTRMRTSGMGASLLDVAGSMRVATTAALTALTTLDQLPIAESIGNPQRVNPAAATEEQTVEVPTLLYKPEISNGEHPLVLGQNEGLVLRNRNVWPAAGTGMLAIEIAWTEVTAF